ncbi:hypothetical protein [Chitinophaga sp.]|uniref:hypothetical protein n=1 Tax=Chitinophaga sp. TaxID=1869181 RepID=UPI002F94F3A9
MRLIKIKDLVIIGVMMVAPLLAKGQTTSSSINQQAMENKIVIGRVFVPKSSLEEFRKQSITGPFLKSLPGFVKGQTYEKFDEEGNLSLVSVTTWSNQETYENAEKSLKEYYKSINFNPMAYRARLKITAEHGVYSMHDY